MLAPGPRLPLVDVFRHGLTRRREIAAKTRLYCGLGWLATEGAVVDGWLLRQVSTVLTALSHAQELFDGTGRPVLPTEFAPRPDLLDNLGDGLL